MAIGLQRELYASVCGELIEHSMDCVQSALILIQLARIAGTVLTENAAPCDNIERAEADCEVITLARIGQGAFAKCAGLGAQLDALYHGCVYDTCVDQSLRCKALTHLVHACQVRYWFLKRSPTVSQRRRGTLMQHDGLRDTN